MKKILPIIGGTLLSLPLVADAFTFTGNNTCTVTGNFQGFKKFLCDIGDIMDMLIVLLIGAALLVFLWGLVKFIANASNEKAREAGRQLMVWGVIALFVMSSIGGILYFLQQDLDIQPTPIDLPTFTP